MTIDCREKILKEIEILFQNFDVDDAEILTNNIIKILSNYEIMNRSTELVPLDSTNDKTLKRYSACLAIDGKSNKTVYQYIRMCKKLSDTLEKPFTEMGIYDLRFFLALEKDRGVSNISLENTRSYLSAFFQWLTDEEVIPKNPMSKIKTIKFKEEIKKPFSAVEINALRGACKTKKERAIIELLLSSGIRVSELTSMKVEDIDFQNLEVHVVNGKGDKERTTYTTQLAAKYIKAYLEEDGGIDDREYLFYNIKKEQLNSGGVRYLLKELGKRAGVENVHPHRFRRTFATDLANKGMDIQDIQELLGHARIETTLIYINSNKQKVKAAYKKYIN